MKGRSPSWWIPPKPSKHLLLPRNGQWPEALLVLRMPRGRLTMDLSGFRCRGALFSKRIITWGLRPKFAHRNAPRTWVTPQSPEVRASGGKRRLSKDDITYEKTCQEPASDPSPVRDGADEHRAIREGRGTRPIGPRCSAEPSRPPRVHPGFGFISACGRIGVGGSGSEPAS